jgi:5S rRNA maturation endonuclease (ribonuclease M5)/archaellum biogenesis ATPase FlaH
LSTQEIDVAEYLKSKGYTGRKQGNEVAFPCFACGEEGNSRKKKLYVNSTTGLALCFVCGWKGGSYLVQKEFGDEPVKNDDGEWSFGPSKFEVLTVAADLAHEWCLQSEVALNYLCDVRGFSADLIKSRKYGFVPQRWSLGESLPFRRGDVEAAGITDAFEGKILIPYYQNGVCVQLRAKDPNGRYYTPPGQRARLYGADDVRDAEEVVIVEGEFDAAVLAECLADAPGTSQMRVCGLAGVQTWPEDADAILSKAKRVYIATDPDEAGRKGAEKILENVGAKGRILEWGESVLERPLADGLQEKEIDWNELISRYDFTAQDFLGMLKGSGSRLLTLGDAAKRIAERPTEGLKTGFTEIDKWISPGLLPGQLMIPLAKTGTGKSILLCNMAVNARSEGVLFLTLEMTAEEIYDRLIKIFRFYRPYYSEYQIQQELANILICDENRLSENDISVLIDEYEFVTGSRPGLVLVDYLGYWARGASGNSNYEKVTNAVMSLKATAKRERLVIVSPHQVNRSSQEGKPLDLDDARDSGAVEETADFLMSVYRPEDALGTNGRVGLPNGNLKMGLLKSRHGNRGRVASVQMGMLSLVMVDAHGKYAAQAQHESELIEKGYDYDGYHKYIAPPIQAEMETEE